MPSQAIVLFEYSTQYELADSFSFFESMITDF